MPVYEWVTESIMDTREVPVYGLVQERVEVEKTRQVPVYKFVPEHVQVWRTREVPVHRVVTSKVRVAPFRERVRFQSPCESTTVRGYRVRYCPSPRTRWQDVYNYQIRTQTVLVGTRTERYTVTGIQMVYKQTGTRTETFDTGRKKLVYKDTGRTKTVTQTKTRKVHKGCPGGYYELNNPAMRAWFLEGVVVFDEPSEHHDVSAVRDVVWVGPLAGHPKCYQATAKKAGPSIVSRVLTVIDGVTHIVEDGAVVTTKIVVGGTEHVISGGRAVIGNVTYIVRAGRVVATNIVVAGKNYAITAGRVVIDGVTFVVEQGRIVINNAADIVGTAVESALAKAIKEHLSTFTKAALKDYCLDPLTSAATGALVAGAVFSAGATFGTSAVAGAVVGGLTTSTCDDLRDWYDPAPAPPGPVSDMSLVAGDGLIRVTWLAPPETDTRGFGYDIHWKLASRSWGGVSSRQARLSASATAYTIRGLVNDRAYTVQVTARNDGGISAAVTGTATPAAATSATTRRTATPTVTTTRKATTTTTTTTTELPSFA